MRGKNTSIRATNMGIKKKKKGKKGKKKRKLKAFLMEERTKKKNEFEENVVIDREATDSLHGLIKRNSLINID